MYGQSDMYEPPQWAPLETTIMLNSSTQQTPIITQKLWMSGIDFDLQVTRGIGEYQVQLMCLPGRIDPHWSIEFEMDYTARLEGALRTRTERLSANSKKQSFAFKIVANDGALVDMELSVTLTIIDATAIHPPLGFEFTKKTTLSDATLIVEGQRLYVTKSILAMQCSYFRQLFNENNKSEYELDDVSVEDFLIFLTLIYPHTVHSNLPIFTTAATMAEVDKLDIILHIARRFECPTLVSLLEENLVSRSLPKHQSLILSGKHELSHLASRGLKSLQARSNFKSLLKDSSEKLSDELRSHILETVVDKMTTAPRRPVQPSSCSQANGSTSTHTTIQPNQLQAHALRVQHRLLQQQQMHQQIQLHHQQMMAQMRRRSVHYPLSPPPQPQPNQRSSLLAPVPSNPLAIPPPMYPTYTLQSYHRLNTRPAASNDQSSSTAPSSSGAVVGSSTDGPPSKRIKTEDAS